MAERALNRQAEAEFADLAMPDQDLRARFKDVAAPGLEGRASPIAARSFVFAAAVFLGALMGALLLHWFYQDGSISVTEWLLIPLMAGLFAWESLHAATAVLGLFYRWSPRVSGVVPGLNVAILLPMFGEDAGVTVPRAAKLLGSLSGGTAHRYALHILSDTRDENSVRQERHWVRVAANAHGHLTFDYHHRSENVDYKSGNIRAWIIENAAPYDALVMLDADSVMERDSVLHLTDALAADPACGLIQTLPRILPGVTIWQNMQALASKIYGALYGRGLSLWMGDSANYYGHNAIIRTRAFAACAGLPRLDAARPLGGTIMSHDFVEAALMRRAGWGVKLLADVEASFEETPADLAQYLKRDARWCFGNMQHMRLVRAKGLHPLSRFHFMSGVMTYWSSLFWLATLLLWTFHGASGTPEASDNGAVFVILGLFATVLFLPKLLGALTYVYSAARNEPTSKILRSVGLEIIGSSLVAPLLMVQRTAMIVRILMGGGVCWLPKNTSLPPFASLRTAHAIEMILGLILGSLVLAGLASFWMLPVALCLTFSMLIARFVARDMQGCRLGQ